MVQINAAPGINMDRTGVQQKKPCTRSCDRQNVSFGKKPSDSVPGAPDLDEAASEMLSEFRILGEFKDKKGLEQTTDLHIGPDIRYALTSKDIDFLKRIKWGPLTLGELREVTYRIREIEGKSIQNHNVLSGKLIDPGVYHPSDSRGMKIDIKI